MAINNIKATINADSVNYSPVGVVKTEDTVMLELSVLKAGELVDFTNQQVYISALRSDNELVQQESFIAVNNTTLKILLNNKFNCLQGIVKCELTIKDSEGATTTADFYFRVNSKIMSKENLDKTGYIETLDKVKLEFVESSEVLKGDFIQSGTVLKEDFVISSEKLKKDFVDSSNVLKDEFIRSSGDEINNFNINSTSVIDSFNQKGNVVIEEVKGNSTQVIDDFNVNSNNNINDFNVAANEQLEKQRNEYVELEKSILEKLGKVISEKLQELHNSKIFSDISIFSIITITEADSIVEGVLDNGQVIGAVSLKPSEDCSIEFTYVNDDGTTQLNKELKANGVYSFEDIKEISNIIVKGNIGNIIEVAIGVRTG